MKIAPNRHEVIEVLRALVNGSVSRSEACEWASARRGAPTPGGYTWDGARDPILQEAFSLVLACDVSEADLGTRGQPYFIRKMDLDRYLSALASNGGDHQEDTGLSSKLPHEVRNARLTAMVRISPDEVYSRIRMNHVRGIDDLDYFQMLAFDDESGHQFMMVWRPRGPSPSEAEVYLERAGSEGRTDLNDLLERLRCTVESVTWLNDEP